MEFMNRGTQPASAARPAPASAAGAASSAANSKRTWKHSPKWLRIMWVVLLFAVTVLAVLVLVLIYVGKTKESGYIDTKKEQAVFLTNGQVYFGKIKAINRSFMELTNIYYLNVSQQVQPKEGDQQQSSVTLVRLGCELHGPADKMIINRDQITFWENLKDDGQVSKAIAQYLKQNPSGSNDCSQSSTSNSTPSSTQP